MWGTATASYQIEDATNEGVAFYNDLINELLANGIEPMVTLNHWDLPLALQTEFDGWLGGAVIQDAFVAYAHVCFQHFGDRVESWLTLNDSWCSAFLDHAWGAHAPGRCIHGEYWAYMAGHNLLLYLLLAHAKAVDLYRREFKPHQHGRIAITINSDWSEPNPTIDVQEFERNKAAAERAVLFFFGWFADPIFFGDYPEIMRQRAGDRLPNFTDDEKKLVKGQHRLSPTELVHHTIRSSKRELPRRKHPTRAGEYGQ